MLILIIFLVLCGILHGTCQNVQQSLETDEYILLATTKNIIRVQVPSNARQSLPIKDVTFINSLEYDVKRNCIFWADYTRVVRQCFNGNADDSVELLVSGGVDKIQDIAYDWLAEKLYYVDSRAIYAIDTSARGTAEAAGKDHWRRTIVKLGEAITTGIVVHPERGYIFWTQYLNVDNLTDSTSEHVGVFRANLDGSDKMVIAHQLNAPRPVKISVDYLTDRVYWIDNVPRIDAYVGSCRLNGERFARHFALDSKSNDESDDEGIASPLTLSVNNDVVYLIDGNNKVRASDVRYPNAAPVLIATDPETIKDFRVYYRGAQSGSNACSIGRHNCTSFCVSAPNWRFKCLCPDDTVQLSNGQCKCQGSDVLEDCYSHLVWVKNCLPNEVIHCDRKACLPLEYRCGKFFFHTCL